MTPAEMLWHMQQLTCTQEAVCTLILSALLCSSQAFCILQKLFHVCQPQEPAA